MLTLKHLPVLVSLFALTLLSLATRAQQVPDTLQYSIAAPPVGVQSEVQIGTSVAAEGGIVAVGNIGDRDGTGIGTVKVFDSATGGLLHVLRNPVPGLASYGQSVAISGTRIVVGAYRDDSEATNAGRAYVYDLASETPTVPVITLTNPEPTADDEFGFSVGISGTRIVVGARFNDPAVTNSGSVYVFDLESGTPTVPVMTLDNPQPTANDLFGHTVAVSGTRVVVGAHLEDAGATDAGTAYIYDVTSPTPTVPVLTLTNPNAASTLNSHFGVSVAIEGTRVIVGAPEDTTSVVRAGTVYVFELSSATPLVPTVTLNNPEPGSNDAFGRSVAVSGSLVAAGAYMHDLPTGEGGGLHVNAGSAYVYDLNGGTPTVPVVTLNNPEPASTDEFGSAVAVTSARVVVGAHFDNAGATHKGNAYLYDLTAASPSSPIATLASPSPSAGDNFGWSVAASGQYVVAGAYLESTGANGAGSVYVYDLLSGSPTVPVLTFHNPDPDSFGNFGRSVAIDGSRVVVGAGGIDARVYVYQLSGPDPATPVLTLSKPNSGLSTEFGCSVAIYSARIIVGDKDDDTGATNAGSVFVYDLISPTPTVPVGTLNNPAPAQNDRFGNAVAFDGQRVLVGAEEDNGGVSISGAAYLYDLTPGSPTGPVHTFLNPTPASLDDFGHSVALNGMRVVIGAPGDDAGASNAGIAYVYNLLGATPTTPDSTLSNPAPAANDGFGESVALSNATVLVGASRDDAGATDTGAAYVYHLGSATPTVPAATLNNPGEGTQDLFGYSVALFNTTAIIGAPFHDSPQVDKGSIYVYVPEDAITQPPGLTAPASGTVTGNPINVGFSLPEAALSQSVNLEFAGATTHTLVLESTDETIGAHTFSFDPADPAASSHVRTGTAIPDGIYSVTLSYRGASGSPPASVSAENVTVDTTAPLITNLPSNVIVAATDASGAIVTYTMPGVSDSGSATSLTASVQSGATFPLGITTVIFTAKDAANNTSTASFTVNVRPIAPVTAVVVAQGDNAPGAGTPGGPPAGAKLTSFGVPAVDADEHVAFKASWTSPEGSGTGIFRDEALVARVGGAVPGLPDVSYKTFADPVIEAGRVAFIATVAGAPKAQSSVVVSDVSGFFELIAQSGTGAPQTGEQPFKSFKSVALSGNKLGLYAYITSAKSFANDMGVWVKKGAFFPLELTLRETYYSGVEAEIKKLITFTGGNGSPGQGRGWLVDTGDGAQVLAHATLNKSQAIIAAVISAPLNQLPHPVILLKSGPESGFSSFGLPIVNSSNQVAFLASLAIGNDVTKANARGIFADLESDGTYSSIVRVGDPAAPSGSTFGVLKDPVLAADGGLAFPATLKGKTVQGLATQTLWWKPAGGELTLLAQGGASAVPVADLPGAQWKSFPSLAIAANRGPIFTGALVPGKGGVTKATSSGVWAVDFKGDLRLLFQTGVTQIDGKVVKSFTLLNANVGSQGTTRSFNDNALVVWRATFEDKSQAIVTTEIP